AFRLSVLDNSGATAADTMQVSVAAAAVVNQPPVANAGADTGIVLPVNTVALNGSKSKDADGTISSYSWSMISGPSTATITNANTVTATAGGLLTGVYAFRLSVTDNSGATAADTVQVTVVAAAVPTAPAVGGTGLHADYYTTNNLTGPIALSRTDTTVNFDWGYGAPASTVYVTDNFSIRWAGQVLAPYSETYTFYTNSDDGVRLWVNGRQIINNWTDHAATENSGTITLVAGQKYDIVMEYYEKGAAAVAKLSWSSPSAAKAIIPKRYLYPTVAAAAVTTGNGTGLKGEYYTTNNLSGAIALTRTDSTVNFDWGYGAPASTVYVTDNFSVRWSGQVQAVYSETYTFYTNSDDGVRLWVNGQQIINNWKDHGLTENSATITLVAGQKYSIVMEYYEKGLMAVAKLSWSSASTPKAIVPKSQLYPSATSSTTSTASTARMVTEDATIPTFAGKEGLAPNPVTAGQASRLSFNSAGGTASVQVIDASGRIAFVQQVNAAEGANNMMIPTTGLRTGMYVVRVVQAGKATSYKLLVQ
ncbi:MAG TPA: PA14 domain-containing protein, partial [Chitinophagaceae bacterium]|nr:PA14 domain-containing protein [Chitinophagaceae bacterium]